MKVEARHSDDALPPPKLDVILCADVTLETLSLRITERILSLICPVCFIVCMYSFFFNDLMWIPCVAKAVMLLIEVSRLSWWKMSLDAVILVHKMTTRAYRFGTRRFGLDYSNHCANVNE